MGNCCQNCPEKGKNSDISHLSVYRPVYYFKILLVGDRNVGKSCLLNRFINGSAPMDGQISPTIGVDFVRKSIQIDDFLVKFHFWDPSGDQRFHSILPNYFLGINAVLFMYDITDEQSFKSLTDIWFRLIKTNSRPQPTMKLIIGNKTDLSSNRMISITKAIQLANETNSLFMEVSAKSGHNVDNLLFIVGQQLIAFHQQISQQ